MIQMVIEVAGECGLNINKVKSNVLLYNHDGIRLEEVGGIRVSNTIRYFCADVGDSRMCFCEYRKGKIQLPERMANLTFSVISKSCDKLLIDKTYWKRCTIMENWNQDHPERYSNFQRKFVKFQGCGKWPWSW